MQAAGALQRASEAQQARSEAARGGRAPSAMLEAELAAAQQMAGVEQQKMLDQLSQQTAERKAATRQQMQMSALQAEAQAQAIDPIAQQKAARAAAFGQAIGQIGAPLSQLGMAELAQGAKGRGTAKAIEELKGAGLSEQQAIDALNGKSYSSVTAPGGYGSMSS